MRLFKLTIVGFVLMALSACSMLEPKVDQVRARKVKKMAIIAFEVHQQQPKDALGISKISSTPKNESKELKSMTKGIYKLLTKKTEATTGWKVIGWSKVANSPKYKKLYKQKMTGLKRVSISGPNTEVISAPGILNSVNFRLLSQSEKVALAKSLGVDAFAEYIAYQTIDQGISFGNLVGEADFQLTHRSNILVYDLKSEEPLWRAQNIDGEESVEAGSLGKGLSQLQKLSKVGYLSSKSSISNMVETYKR